MNINCLLKERTMQGINSNFLSVLLVFGLSACSNAAEYKPQRLDEKTVYKNSEHELNSIYFDIKAMLVIIKTKLSILLILNALG